MASVRKRKGKLNSVALTSKKDKENTVNSLRATTSRKRPPLVSDHFVVPQGWSLTRELTVHVPGTTNEGYNGM